MFRRIFSVAAAAILASNAATAAGAPNVGTEPAARCMPIRTAQDLNRIRARLGRSFCLKQDIDLGGIANFLPIGDYGKPFRGVFDGEGHTIRNLRVDRSNAPAALFVEVLGTIRNLRLANVDIKSTGGDPRAAAFAISLTSFTNTTGSTAGVLENVRSTGSVVSEGSSGIAGGLVAITGQSTIIRRSSAATRVIAGAAGQAGGLVGSSGFSARIDKSRATGRVSSGRSGYAGGLVGLGGGKITRSYARGSVSVGDGGYAGGLAGATGASLQAVFATGRVSGGVSSTVGGLIGQFYSGSSGSLAKLNQSYAAGKVGPVGASSRVGGLIGLRYGGRVSASYWDVNKTGQMSSKGGKPLTTQQLEGPLPQGFSPSLWSDRPDAYPRLK